MTQWKLVSDSNESEPIDDHDEAMSEKADLEALGATVKVRPVAGDDEAADDSSDDEAADDEADADSEVIEMSVQDGGNRTDTDDDDALPEPRDELDGYGGLVSFCPTCNRFSFEIYRCQFDDCGRDLTDEPNIDGDRL